MNMQHLKKGQIFKYIGKPFLNFKATEPEVTFLGYDSNGWNEIWVAYKSVPIMILLKDIELIK